MKLKVYAPLLWRFAVFVGVFAVLSSWIGLRIINNNLLYDYYFVIYGSLGKAMLFGVLAFGLLVGKRFKDIRIRSWGLQDAWWLLGAGLVFAGASWSVDRLASGDAGVLWAIFTHVLLLAFVGFLAIGCFGLQALLQVWQKFKKELAVAAGLALAFEGFIFVVYGLWEYLSSAAMYATHWLLGLFGLRSEIILPHTLVFDRFGIEVAKYCSGIESIALFTGLYVVIGIVDWQRFNHRRFLGAFVPGLIVLFCFNILRISILITLGYFINPKIAFTLFHTYAGMLLFIIYSAIFWRVTYQWMLRTDSKSTQ